MSPLFYLKNQDMPVACATAGRSQGVESKRTLAAKMLWSMAFPTVRNEKMTKPLCPPWLRWLGICLLGPAAALAQEPVRLRENFSPGYQYHVSTRTELSGTLTLPADKPG